MWKRSKTEGEKLSEEEIKPSEIEDIEGKLEEIETLVLRLEKEKNKTEEKKRKHLEEAEKKKKKIKLDCMEIKKTVEEKWAIVRWTLELRDIKQIKWDSDKELRQKEKEGTVRTPISEEFISATEPVRGKKGG